MTDSQQLLAEYARNGSDAAFRELVTRYVDLVYSTALRLVEGDAHRAEDVTQTVFVDLSRKARTLPADVRLGGWLHRDTCLVAGHTLRGERRRQSRERQAAEMNALQIHSEADFSQVAPLLDEAINELGEADRTAILLRFFEQQDFRAVGQALGSNEDAARMRVTRALEKLEEFLKRRGVTTSAASLGVVLAANAVQAAPVGLAVTISTAAALAGTTLATTVTATATKAIAMTTLQKTLITATIVAAVGAGIYEARQASQLGDQVQTLQQQQKPLAEQIQQLQRERNDTTNRLVWQADELARAKSNNLELLKLRGEVGRLRRESQELAHLKSNGSTNETELADKSWLDRVGRLKQRLAQTPEAKIPELQFLTEQDWLNAASPSNKLDTEDDYRAAFADLRQRGEGRFLDLAQDALRKYIAESKGQFPTDLSQLELSFKDASVAKILQRYQIVPSKNIPQANIDGKQGDWLITLRVQDSGSQWGLGLNGVSGTSREDSDTMAILAPALKALMDDTPRINGGKRVRMQELPPYLTTPEQKAAYQKLMQRSNLPAN